MTAQLKPVGQRPRCLHCGKELRPHFRRERPPLNVESGKTFTHMETLNFITGEKRERTSPIYRATTEAERREFRKEHPPEFIGYGNFKDNRFCGLNCGYDWAIARTSHNTHKPLFGRESWPPRPTRTPSRSSSTSTRSRAIRDWTTN